MQEYTLSGDYSDPRSPDSEYILISLFAPRPNFKSRIRFPASDFTLEDRMFRYLEGTYASYILQLNYRIFGVLSVIKVLFNV